MDFIFQEKVTHNGAQNKYEIWVLCNYWNISHYLCEEIMALVAHTLETTDWKNEVCLFMLYYQ